ncbi:DUF4131 domain-containing protein, partial [Candidatus Falkowbacteria bacterium]|nr:DUF4131 domain-containing protein [Candidatus Falkowbacteria bacterium]
MKTSNLPDNIDPLIVSCIFFAAGIIIASFLPHELLAPKWWFVAMVLFFVLAFHLRGLKYFFLFGGMVSLALWRYDLSFPLDSPSAVWKFNQTKVVISGRIVQEPEISQSDQKLVIAADELFEPHQQKLSGLVLASLTTIPEFSYGEKIKFECKLKTPAPIDNFAYDRYLAKDGIYSLCYQPTILKRESLVLSGLPAIEQQLLKLKSWCRRQLFATLSEPASGLAAGMILGDQWL